MKHLALILNLCIAALIATTAPARAAPRNISAEIAEHRGDFVSAKVFHLADSLSYRTRREEEDVAKGCFYAASGDDLSTLLGVLVLGGLHEVEPSAYGFEVRTVVYLAKRDGGTVPLLLNLRAPAMPSYGSYDRMVPVATDGAFSTALHAWMAPRTEIDPETSRPCTGFIKFD